VGKKIKTQTTQFPEKEKMLNESFLVTPSIDDIHLVETAISDIKLLVVYQSNHLKSTGKYYKQSDRNCLKYGKTPHDGNHGAFV
jgi:hypothetical protein